MSKGGGSVFDMAPFFGGEVGRSSPPNVKKKNKVSLCSACFNNFHKFSSEIKKNCRREGKERRKGTDRDLGVKEERAPEKQLH